jgi:hypothetical protein
MDLSGSGTTAQWATVVVTLLAGGGAFVLACKQLAIMKRQEQRQSRAFLIANFRKLHVPHPTEQIAPLPDSGLSNLELEIRNLGPAEARKIRATLKGIGQQKKMLAHSNIEIPEAIASGDKRTFKYETQFWRQVVITKLGG